MIAKPMYVIRRKDGEPIFGEWSHVIAEGPDDWTAAEDDSDEIDTPVTYEMVEMTPRVLAERTLPTHEGERP